MGNYRPTERRCRARRSPLMNGLTRMMTTSLVVYVVAILMQRTWALLNADVVQIVRRS